MKQVKMLQDEVIAWGPQRLVAGETYSLPDEVAASLVDLGAAVYDEAASDKTGDEVILPDVVDLDSLTVPVLKEMAEAAEVSGYSSMKKAELIEALSK